MNLKLLTILLTLTLLFSGASLAAGLQVQVIDEQGKPVAGAVVFLESAAASAAVKPVDDARIVQKDKTFIPDVLVIPRGTAVYFPNEDTVRHHVYSFSAIKPFEIKLYVGTPAAPVLFDQSGVAVLGCNIHDEMIAWVVALDTPYYSRSDQQGLSRLEQVPPGRYTLRVWHKDLLNEQDVPRLAIEIGQQPQQTTVQLPKLAPVF
ncbi:methylamine utilization protein [Alishewanella sp. BS5-314]|uniref:methylamine utilization protein n=1 Tax=Alishewanella sp. BS5-314 TaxID=2755587 RepID=UPI0021BB5572|nr:methylamine utilization protein [Alishewanella sp. BS5-314]MCT8126156.1 methylamine utilization protein [Alishewanella sp. BS5-314]